MHYRREIASVLDGEAQHIQVHHREVGSILARIRRRRSTVAALSGLAMIGALIGSVGLWRSIGSAAPERAGKTDSELAAGLLAIPERGGWLFTGLTEGGEPQLFFTDSEGGSVRQVTEGKATRGASYSPGGNSIVVARGGEDDSQLYVMSSDGSNLRPLTKGSSDSEPAWSPAGDRIAFVRTEGGDDDIYTVNADGTDVRQLTTSALPEFQPSWSPDGRLIVFTAARAGDGSLDIYTMDAFGENFRSLTDTDGSESSPVWSPDGSRIAFAYEEADSDTADVWVVNRDGSEAQSLFAGDVDERPASWPEESQILYAGGVAGKWTLNVFDAERDGHSQLTPHPMWVPLRVAWSK